MFWGEEGHGFMRSDLYSERGIRRSYIYCSVMISLKVPIMIILLANVP